MSGQTDAVRQLMLGLADQWQPFYEAAEGQKAELERRGWSPSAAEAVAEEMLRGFVKLALRGTQGAS